MNVIQIVFVLSLFNIIFLFSDVSSNVVTTMASETTLFKKRIVTLIQITNALGNFDLSYLLQSLGERVCATGNLNSGGKFEWIDSILVKVSMYNVYILCVWIYTYLFTVFKIFYLLIL